FCFYYWMFFPKDTLEFSDQFLTAKAAQPQHLEAWKRNYLRFVKRCILLTGGRQFISKNPPNTARIPLLLELFPDAKFIFLHRNPYEVVRSTFRFYKGVLPAQQHQSISDEELETQVLRIYQELHDKFLNDRSLIPKGNLVELAFENFVADPLNTARTIMDQFGVPTQIKPRTWQKYGQNHRGAKHYEYSPGWIQQVNTQLGSYFEEFEYAMQKD
ncbi:MAG: sulfotransferase, partial [Phaeodactylibacter sp.]|nr:sulfotransferase [Phaeodactylibacter sp.]